MDKVDAYIKKQKSPQKEICSRLRKLLLASGASEEFKLGVPWYGKFYIVALKDHVNIGFSVKGLSKSEQALFEGKGKLMRHIKIRSLKELDEKKLKKMINIVKKKSKCSYP